MAEPHVVAIMLIADRRALGERAVDCFRKQTYENRSLVIFDTGREAFRKGFHPGAREDWWWEEPTGRTIGELRNAAADIASARHADIIVHWDSDDWSHPRRIEEQVALLKDDEADCVGYGDMLFWREGQRRATFRSGQWEEPGQAWLWRGASNRPIGTSLCYWRRIWEAHPFARLPIGDSTGEDVDFVRRVNSFAGPSLFRAMGPTGSGHEDLQPRMIARIHDGNTSRGYAKIGNSSSWSRAAEFDKLCREVMV